MVSWVLIGLDGWAADPAALIDAVSRGAGARPDVVVACAPFEVVLRPGVIPASLRGELEAAWGGVPSTGLPADVRARLVGPDPGLGVDVRGALGVTRWKDGSWRVDLAFSGTRTDAGSWLDDLSGVVATRGQGWNLVKGGVVTDAVLVDGSLGLYPHEGQAAVKGFGRPLGLLDGLPDEAGCLVYRELEGARGRLAVATWTPITPAAPVRVRVGAAPAPLGPPGLGAPPPFEVPSALATGGAAPFGGASITTPDLVVTVGVPWSNLSGTAALLPPELVAAPGATFARFGAELVAVLPVLSDGVAPSAERLNRILRNFEPAFSSEARVVAVDGAWIVGPAARVAEVAAGRGTPWVDARLRSVAEVSPVAATAPGRSAVGARAVAGGWEFVLDPSEGSSVSTAEWVALADGALMPRRWLVAPQDLR